MLHNLRINVNGPYLPRWRLHVKNITLIREQVEKREDINLSDANRSVKLVMEQLTLQRLGGVDLGAYGKDTISQDSPCCKVNPCCKVKKFECINALWVLK